MTTASSTALLATDTATAIGRSFVALGTVLAVLAVIVAIGTYRARRDWERVVHTPLTTRDLVGMPPEMVLARADSGLLNADHEKLAMAALRLAEIGHDQRAAYLLHALRRASHRADQLLPYLAELPTEELEAHEALVRALPRYLAEAVMRRETGLASVA